LTSAFRDASVIPRFFERKLTTFARSSNRAHTAPSSVPSPTSLEARLFFSLAIRRSAV